MAVLALVGSTAWVLGRPFEQAVYLGPVIVVGGAAMAGLLVLWGKLAVNSLRESRRPRLVLGLWLLGIGLLVLLTFLGGELPREG